MELSVREAAALLDRSPRTLRAQLARGELPAVKRSGQWWVHRRDLPLTEAQRRRAADKAESVRRAVDDVLPSRLDGKVGRSVADLDAFRHGAALLAEVRADTEVSEALRERAAAGLEEALLALSEAVLHFDRNAKLEAVERSRRGFARVVGMLLVEAGIPPAEPVHAWVQALERDVLKAVAGFARWTEKLKGSRR